MTQKLLEWFFTAVYYLIIHTVVAYCFRNAPVNFLWDILSIVLLIIGFVVSVALANWTVRKIKETL